MMTTVQLMNSARVRSHFNLVTERRTMKMCTKCLAKKPLGEFYRRTASLDGLAPKCKECDKAARSAHYYTNWARERKARRSWEDKNKGSTRLSKRAWLERNKHKKKASQSINNGIRAGNISRPRNCEECGRCCKPEGHHEDYSKPLEVIWLCTRCHGLAHHNLRMEQA